MKILINAGQKLTVKRNDYQDRNDWNQSNHFLLDIEGEWYGTPFQIHILSEGECGVYLTAELEGLGWMVRDSLYGGGPEEDWNLSPVFSTLIDEFLEFVDEVDERPWKWA